MRLLHFTAQFSSFCFSVQLLGTWIYFLGKRNGMLSQTNSTQKQQFSSKRINFFWNIVYYSTLEDSRTFWVQARDEWKIFFGKVGGSSGVWRTIKEWRSKAGIILILRLSRRKLPNYFKPIDFYVDFRKCTNQSSKREYWSDFREFPFQIWKGDKLMSFISQCGATFPVKYTYYFMGKAWISFLDAVFFVTWLSSVHIFAVFYINIGLYWAPKILTNKHLLDGHLGCSPHCSIYRCFLLLRECLGNEAV